jgi:hypothetical protein
MIDIIILISKYKDIILDIKNIDIQRISKVISDQNIRIFKIFAQHQLYVKSSFVPICNWSFI